MNRNHRTVQFGAGNRISCVVLAACIIFATVLPLRAQTSSRLDARRRIRVVEPSRLPARVQTAGSLDPTFGTNGKVFTATSGGFTDFGNDAAVQPDGKIVVAVSNTGNASFNNNFVVQRYNSNGALDSSFGANGTTTINLGNSSSITKIALQSDGKIVAVGVVRNSQTGAFTTVRLNSDGTLDTAFGANGIAQTAVGANGSATDAAVQADGKIVVVGMSRISGGSGTTFDFVAIRYNSNGTPDADFENDGIATADFGSEDSAAAVAVQADGKIVVAGATFGVGAQTTRDIAVVRFNQNGALDAAFDGDGKLTTNLSSGSTNYNEAASAIALQPDGKIVVAGFSITFQAVGVPTTTFSNFAVVRYDQNGALDAAFDNDGIATTNFSGFNDGATSIAIQSSGKIVVGGYGQDSQNSNYRDFALARYDSNGALDQTFGSGGKVSLDFDAGSNESIRAVAVQPDNKIVAVGSTFAGSNLQPGVAIVRFNGGANAARSPFDFDGDGRTDFAVWRANEAVWYLQQSQNGFAAARWGVSSDRIVPADYDGDGKTDIAIYRNGTWWLSQSRNGIYTVDFGIAEDIPVPADYTGDGRAEIAVWRPSSGVWYTLNLADNSVSSTQWGSPGDKPVAADYDGDRKADLAIYRGGEWWLLQSSNNSARVERFGLATDKPVPADYDGDGKTDLAIFRNGTWWLSQSQDGIAAFDWGVATDEPTIGDYDGDGRADAVIYRDGNWWQRFANGGYSVYQFGLNGDKPVSAAFVR